MLNAQWLLENHRNHLALEKYLLSRIESILQPNISENHAEISGQTLRCPAPGMPPQKNEWGSSTERIALFLQERKSNSVPGMLPQCKELLRSCQFMIELYDVILALLPPREAWLVDAIYHQALTIAEMQSMPASPFSTCNRSTIYRKQKRIIQNADRFIQTYIPKEVIQCQPERFISELKRLHRKSITS